MLNMTSVVGAAVIGSVDLLAKVIFAVLDMYFVALTLGCKLASFTINNTYPSW